MRSLPMKLWLLIALVVATSWVPSSARAVAETGQGAKLADKDANTKRYFDAEVDTLAPSR